MDGSLGIRTTDCLWATGGARPGSRAHGDRPVYSAALEDRGLAIGPDADRVTIMRRVSFDVTGLPPSLGEISEFVNDTEPAHERLVERLLASPHYGERWGKYWLDASGYSDSNGYFSADSDRPLAYRYRDYVIRSFNADRPLDQIVREQLAGDEMAGERAGRYARSVVIDRLIATHSRAMARMAPVRATATQTKFERTSTLCLRERSRSSGHRSWGSRFSVPSVTITSSSR